jgi:hypothetical protein
MVWPDILLALVRCELKARYNAWGWQLSAKRALPIVLLTIALLVVWGR